MNGTGLHILRKWIQGGCKPAENCHLRISTQVVHRGLYVHTTPNLFYIILTSFIFNLIENQAEINGVNIYNKNVFGLFDMEAGYSGKE